MVLGEYLLRQVSAVEQLQQMSHFKVPDSTTSLASFFPSFLPLSPSHPQKSRKRHLQKLLRSCMASLGAFYCMIGKPPELCVAVSSLRPFLSLPLFYVTLHRLLSGMRCESGQQSSRAVCRHVSLIFPGWLALRKGVSLCARCYRFLKISLSAFHVKSLVQVLREKRAEPDVMQYKE